MKGILFIVFSAAVAPFCAVGDLGAALRRTRSPAVTALPKAPASGHLVVPLKRVAARAAFEGMNVDASFYVGSIFLGQPAQELKVIFDTSSGHVLVPHRACSEVACLEHKRYSPWQSATAMDVTMNGTLVQPGNRIARGKLNRDAVDVAFTQADLGEGTAKSVLVRDHVCLGVGPSGGADCADLTILAAVRMEEQPFREMPNDGVVGLGLEGLSASHSCSFISRMLEESSSTRMLPQFGISYRSDGGEIHFGGHDPAQFTGPLHWFPVDHPEMGYWQVAISSVRVDGVKVDVCQSGCHGVIDTGASRLGVQASKLLALKSALLSYPSQQGCRGPELEFDLGGFTLTLHPEDYADEQCAPSLGSLNLSEQDFVGVYAFGETVLRRYYTAFDWQKKRLGFAPASAASSVRAHRSPMDKSSEYVLV